MMDECIQCKVIIGSRRYIYQCDNCLNFVHKRCIINHVCEPGKMVTFCPVSAYGIRSKKKEIQ